MRILIVDDEQPLRNSMRMLLETYGHQVIEAEDIRHARDLLKSKSRCFDLLLLDLFFGNAPDGLSLLEELKAKTNSPPVIVTSGMGAVSHAVRALKLGARDYLVKPVNPDELCMRLEYFEPDSAPDDHDLQRAAGTGSIHFGDGSVLICRSQSMKCLIKRAERLVDQDFPVLIQGETGVGKSLVARLIHAYGKRANRPFVALNCSAVPPELAETELFGHTKGAFTGANETHPGLLQQADGGTLFLDEIGELTPALQSKLLTAIEEGQIRPVGARNPVSIDVRILCATNRNLSHEMETGHFRSDLYYRISTVALTIAPLRERVEDIRPLTDFILNELRHSFGCEYATIDAATLQALERYDWPGNVRELRNVLVRSMVEMTGLELQVKPEELFCADSRDEPAASSKPRSVISDDSLFIADNILPLEEMERGYMQAVLERLGGNKLAAARALKISRGTLRRKLGKT